MKLRKGDYIYTRGDLSDAMYVVVSGKVGLYSNGEDSSTELVRLGPGQLIGDLAYFMGGLRTSDAKALVETELLKVPYETVRMQFETAPTWVQTMAKTMAAQVLNFSNEIKLLKDTEPGVVLSRLSIARAWASLCFMSQQFGLRSGDSVTVEWSLLRTYSNLCFREVSDSVFKLAGILESLNLCEIQRDKSGPTHIKFLDIKFLPEFLKYYVRAITKNSPELSKIEPIVFETLKVLASSEIKVIPIHRGQVEIDLRDFCKFAQESGHPNVTATSLDLLRAHGLEVQKTSSDESVKVRYHREEIVNRALFWEILIAIQKINVGKSIAAA